MEAGGRMEAGSGFLRRYNFFGDIVEFSRRGAVWQGRFHSSIKIQIPFSFLQIWVWIPSLVENYKVWTLCNTTWQCLLLFKHVARILNL